MYLEWQVLLHAGSGLNFCTLVGLSKSVNTESLKTKYYTYRGEKLTTFKVGSLNLYTLVTLFLPDLEPPLKLNFLNFQQLSSILLSSFCITYLTPKKVFVSS